MKELYQYMVEQRDEIYQTGAKSVTLDTAHFFRLYQAVCYMIQIKNIVNFDEDLSK